MASLVTAVQSLLTIGEVFPEEDLTGEIESLQAALSQAEAGFRHALLFLPPSCAEPTRKYVDAVQNAEINHYVVVSQQGVEKAARTRLLWDIPSGGQALIESLADQLRALLGAESVPSPS